MRPLILGSCTLDISLEIPSLPSPGGDINATGIHVALGGMAYNVYQIMQLMNVSPIFGCPVGQGKLADLTADLLRKEHLQPVGVFHDSDNGFCLCLVDSSGERSFISHHGAEYRFDPSFFSSVNFEQVSYIYATGLEIEDRDGPALIRFLEEKHKPLLFAPGPRLQAIPRSRLSRILHLSPILHLNGYEAKLMTGLSSPEDAALTLSRQTGNVVIITLGNRGALLQEPGQRPRFIPTHAAKVIDTTGAGDNHAGALLACRCQAKSWADSVRFANHISSYVVQQHGAAITADCFAQAISAWSCG